MKNSKGFTLFEILVVIVLIVALSAIVTPAMKEAIRSTKITKSMSNMKQIHASMMLYIIDQSGSESEFEKLPPFLSNLNLPKDILRTGGANRRESEVNIDVYRYMAAFEFKGPYLEWKKHIERTNNNPILLVDETHDLPNDFLFEKHRATGVYFGGNVQRKVGTRSAGDYRYWE